MIELLIKAIQKYYKLFFIISILIWAFFASFIIITKVNTGNWFYKDISIEGGKSLIIKPENNINIGILENKLESELKTNVYVRKLVDPITNKLLGIRIDFPYYINETKVLSIVSSMVKVKDYSLFEFSPAMSEELKTMFYAILIAIAFISLVIFLRIRHPIPSITIILSIFYDLTCTLGFFDLFKIPISLASLGALLMIIGYAIDNNIVLATYYLKDRDLRRGLITGWTMWATTIVALLAILLLVQSQIVKEIAQTLFIAEIFDFVAFTFMNTSIYLLFLKEK